MQQCDLGLVHTEVHGEHPAYGEAPRDPALAGRALGQLARMRTLGLGQHLPGTLGTVLGESRGQHPDLDDGAATAVVLVACWTVMTSPVWSLVDGPTRHLSESYDISRISYHSLRVGQADSVFHIGVDLAWGLRQPTGLAVLDDDGRLVHVSAVRTDEEIRPPWRRTSTGRAWSPSTHPLVVRNATGNRPAEALLNKDFARFDAGAHPANTGKPELDPPRGRGAVRGPGTRPEPPVGT